ncbi:MAG TPA: hypothetical protein VF637_17910 [Sphingomicrobium sp.]|jgi:hypothetical protein
MTKFRKALLAFSSLLATGPAAAQQYACSVNPTGYLGIGADGTVAVTVNGDRVAQICNVSQAIGGVSPEACTAWYSSLLTWRTIGKTGVIFFDSTNPANAGNTACTQFSPTEWIIRIPYHIGAA